jgi:hypothetical protein
MGREWRETCESFEFDWRLRCCSDIYFVINEKRALADIVERLAISSTNNSEIWRPFLGRLVVLLGLDWIIVHSH